MNKRVQIHLRITFRYLLSLIILRVKVTVGLPTQCPFAKNIFENFTLKYIRTLRNYERAIGEKNNKFVMKLLDEGSLKVESLRGDTLLFHKFPLETSHRIRDRNLI